MDRSLLCPQSKLFLLLFQFPTGSSHPEYIPLRWGPMSRTCPRPFPFCCLLEYRGPTLCRGGISTWSSISVIMGLSKEAEGVFSTVGNLVLLGGLGGESFSTSQIMPFGWFTQLLCEILFQNQATAATPSPHGKRWENRIVLYCSEVTHFRSFFSKGNISSQPEVPISTFPSVSHITHSSHVDT